MYTTANGLFMGIHRALLYRLENLYGVCEGVTDCIRQFHYGIESARVHTAYGLTDAFTCLYERNGTGMQHGAGEGGTTATSGDGDDPQPGLRVHVRGTGRQARHQRPTRTIRRPAALRRSKIERTSPPQKGRIGSSRVQRAIRMVGRSPLVESVLPAHDASG